MLKCKCLHYAALGLLALLTACSSVAITGRKQLLLVSDDEVLQLGINSYTQFMASAVRSGNRVQSARVTAVGQRIANATEAYLRSNGREQDAQRFAWEFNLVKDDAINAFCMPGGKIVVYEGLMTLAKSDDELAVVLGHEVAHAVAKHSNERISQMMLANYGSQTALKYIGGNAQTQAIAAQILGLGADWGYIKPFERKHEYEADKMGLVLMAMAGYNPQAAVRFWQSMSQAKGEDPNQNDFFSTHPSDGKRAAELQALMPEAMKIYEQFRHYYTPAASPAATPTKTAPPKRTTPGKGKPRKK